MARCRRPSSGCAMSGVNRADSGRLVQHVGVDHPRAHVTVAQQFLHGADVIAGFQQMGGEQMLEGVTYHALRNAGVTRSGCHCLLQSALVGVVAV